MPFATGSRPETSGGGDRFVSIAPVRLLRSVVVLSAAYDLVLGAALLFAPGTVGAWFGVPPPATPIHANLNGLFAAAIGVGYLVVLPRLDRSRWYLWLMGPGLKGAGAALFVLDFLLRGSPAAFLVFAAGDGSLAVLTWVALRRTRPDG